jgi:polysaccharide biosynthesis/export protein
MRVFARLSLALLGLITLAGCAMAPGLRYESKSFGDTTGHDEEAVLDFDLQLVTPTLLVELQRNARPAALAELPLQVVNETTTSNYRYLIGPQDVLDIIVWGHSDLTIPAGGQRPASEAGHRVAPDGTIYYPHVGVIEVVGRTTHEVRRDLTKRLARYIKEPQLDVRIVAFNSQRITVSGEVVKPGIIPVTDRPLSLMEAIDRAGGFNAQGDSKDVVLIRNNQRYVIDVAMMLTSGNLRHNVLLQNEDVIHVPHVATKKVYLVGEVAKQGAINLKPTMPTTLADVLADSGWLVQNSAGVKDILILRQGEEKPLVYRLDGRRADSLILATRFPMQATDVVYVSTAGLSLWNRVLSQLLPTVEGLWTIDRMTRLTIFE